MFTLCILKNRKEKVRQNRSENEIKLIRVSEQEARRDLLHRARRDLRLMTNFWGFDALAAFSGFVFGFSVFGCVLGELWTKVCVCWGFGEREMRERV